jgi:hypothetical protein
MDAMPQTRYKVTAEPAGTDEKDTGAQVNAD